MAVRKEMEIADCSEQVAMSVKRCLTVWLWWQMVNEVLSLPDSVLSALF